ncbi:MAG: hypothetical protein RhofKO_31000 [Rhodothermales bacterium]
MPYYDDDGTELNPDLIAKPDLCVACECNDSADEMKRVLCDLTRLDQQGEPEFICHAYKPKSSKP